MLFSDPHKQRGSVTVMHFSDPHKQRGSVTVMLFSDPHKRPGDTGVCCCLQDGRAGHPELHRSAGPPQTAAEGTGLMGHLEH